MDVCPSYCLSMKTVDRVEGGEDLKVLLRWSLEIWQWLKNRGRSCCLIR